MTARPLQGRRIVLTRAADDCAAWASRLAELGAEAIVFPCIECEPLDDPELRQAVAELAAAVNWLVFTSRRGVEAFAGLGGRVPPGCQLATVGAATAAAAERLFRRPDLIGGGTAAALADALVELASGSGAGSVVVAVAENANTALEDKLTAAGIECRRLNVYRTVPALTPASPAPSLGDALVVFASPSAVTGFVHRMAAGAPDRKRAPICIAIGPSTAAALRAHGFEVAAEAREPSLDGLVEAMQCLN